MVNKKIHDGLGILISYNGNEIKAVNNTIMIVGPEPKDIDFKSAKLLAANGWNWNEKGWYIFTKN